MFVPTISERAFLNWIYSFAGTLDLILCPFTIFLLLLSAPTYLKVFKRIQLAIVLNALLFATIFFILRPSMTVPLAFYSISQWNWRQEAILWLMVFLVIGLGHTIVFLLVAYFHRVIVLAPISWKKSLKIYYTIFSICFSLFGMSAVGCIVYFYYTEFRYLKDSQFDVIRSFSEVLFLETDSFQALVRVLLPPVLWILITFASSIILIHRFSSNDQKASKRTQEKQNQLFRLTLIQVVILIASIFIPALMIILTAIHWVTIPDIYLYYVFVPVTFHSPGNCIAIICTSHYRKMLILWITGKGKRLGQVTAFWKEDVTSQGISVATSSRSRRKILLSKIVLQLPHNRT